MDKVGVATRGTHQNRAAPTGAAQHQRVGVVLSALPLGLTWLGLAGLWASTPVSKV